MSEGKHGGSRERGYVFGRPLKTGLVGTSMDIGQQVTIVAGMFVAVVGFYTLPGTYTGLVFAFLAVGLAVAVTVVPYRSRTVYGWWGARRHFRRVRKAYTDGGQRGRWRCRRREAGHRLDGSEVPVPPPPGVGEVVWVEVPTRLGTLAVLLQPSAGLVTAALRVIGPGLLMRADKYQLVDQLADALRHLANGDHPVDVVQILARSLPSDPEGMRRDFAVRGSADAPAVLANSYRDVLDAAADAAAEQHVLVVLGSQFGPALAARARRYGSDDMALARVMADSVEEAASLLDDAQIEVVGAADTARVATFIRNSYTPSWPLARTDGMTVRNAWPAFVDAGHDEYLMAAAATPAGPQKSYHATCWVREWPMTRVPAGWLGPLLAGMPGVTRTTSLTMRLEDSSAVLRRLDKAATNLKAEGDRAAGKGKSEDRRDSLDRSRVDEQRDEAAAGGGGVAMAMFITVTADSPETLVDAQRQVARAAARARLAIEWCDFEQDRAFTTTLPLCRGVRPPGTVDELTGVLRRRSVTERPGVVATTGEAAATYLPAASGSWSDRGVVMGTDQDGATVVYCPWMLYDQAKTSEATAADAKTKLFGPNMIVTGDVGGGKSTTVKAYVARQVAFGRQAAVLDSKRQNVSRDAGGESHGEWWDIAQAVPGATVVSVQPGGHYRFNPLDSRIRFTSVDRKGREKVSQVAQLHLLSAMVCLVGDRNLREKEWTALSIAHRAAITIAYTPAPGFPNGREAVLSDVVHALRNPSVEDAESKRNTIDGLRADGADVAHIIDRMVDGDLAGMFEGPTSAEFDLDSPLVVFDLSQIGAESVALPLLMLVVATWLQHAWIQPDGRKRILVIEEAWHLIRNQHTATLFRSLLKLSRGLGLQVISVMHRVADVTGGAAAAEADSLFVDSSTRLVFNQSPDDAARTVEILRLPEWYVELIPRLRRGQSLMVVGGNAKVVQTVLSPWERTVCFTDSAMAEGPSLALVDDVWMGEEGVA